MLFTNTPIPGVVIVDPEPVCDERGTFARSWCQFEFENHGLNGRLVQCSRSVNTHAGTLRGMHYQSAPHLEAKLVRCTRGSAFDAVVDLRAGLPSFGRWFGCEISAANGRALYIPEGVAHGFQTLEDETELFYQISTYYAPEFAAGLRWNDPDIGIEWPECPQRIISERDQEHPGFADICRHHDAMQPRACA